MPRDYKNIKKKKVQPIKNRFSNLLSFLTGLSIGLVVAVIVYFTQHNSTIESNNPLIVSEPSAENIINKDEDIAQLPEPQFDFYKILPSKEVNISEWESIEEEDIANSSDNEQQEPAMFVLQVGSFKQYESADEIKAKLAMVGITADIQRVILNGQDIRHRVRIGPYKNTDKLQQARDRLLANDLDFMLLKLKMEDI